MLKNLAVLTCALLLIPFATYPQAHQAKKAHQRDKPSLPAAPVGPKQSNGPELQPEHKQHVDAEVRVISTPEKDGWDKAAVLVNAVLALITAGGILVAVVTLRKIERQTKATEDAAEAARNSVLVSQSKERGRIRVDLTQPQIQPVSVPTMLGITVYHLPLKVVLEGSSEATILESRELVRICKDGVVPFPHKLLHSTWPRVINPSSSPVHLVAPVLIDAPSLGSGINENHSGSLRKGEMYFLYEASFRYRDVFGGIWTARVKQRFSFVVVPDEVRQIMRPETLTGRWNDAGTPEENSETRNPA